VTFCHTYVSDPEILLALNIVGDFNINHANVGVKTATLCAKPGLPFQPSFSFCVFAPGAKEILESANIKIDNTNYFPYFYCNFYRNRKLWALDPSNLAHCNMDASVTALVRQQKWSPRTGRTHHGAWE
jgi:hypothetical protein